MILSPIFGCNACPSKLPPARARANGRQRRSAAAEVLRPCGTRAALQNFLQLQPGSGLGLQPYSSGSCWFMQWPGTRHMLLHGRIGNTESLFRESLVRICISGNNILSVALSLSLSLSLPPCVSLSFSASFASTGRMKNRKCPNAQISKCPKRTLPSIYQCIFKSIRYPFIILLAIDNSACLYNFP